MLLRLPRKSKRKKKQSELFSDFVLFESINFIDTKFSTSFTSHKIYCAYRRMLNISIHFISDVFAFIDHLLFVQTINFVYSPIIAHFQLNHAIINPLLHIFSFRLVLTNINTDV